MNLRKIVALDSPVRLFYHYLRWVLALYMYGNPSKNMIVIWITWTKGKTTTTNIIAKWLKDAWEKVFMFSTVNYMIWDDLLENNLKMTSPSPFVIQKLLKKAKNAGCKYAVIETSSHSLFYNRNYWIDYDVVVLTNISQDHLDLHKTMDNYTKTKLKLFENLVRYKRKPNVKKVSIVNLDSDFSSDFLGIVDDNKYTYWLTNAAQIRAQNMVFWKDFTEFEVKMPGNVIKMTTKLKWEFNIYNILAAFCVLVSQKIPLESITNTIATTNWIPWRLEEIPNDKWIKVFVDYAHTEESLRNVLDTIKKMGGEWRIITVFWATWDRDKTKRPKMWKVVNDLSDLIVLTDDDTYTENSLAIINDVARWIKRKEGEDFWIIPDREDAIRTAIIMSQPDDVILLAWKWAETVQVTNKWPIPWSDVNICRRIMQEISDNELVR
ncbi:MAG: hypothetical protein ACD_2C00264G0007 [uncultured bacterium (gcode 4)]|uniref:Uncharacterized protein n=1 Tax=uncultured bacterium (gcode 4) TaxID=1234023 RepID=K2G3L6_9BACT|nr:MAG: hypothetical protein ACD_2C00264G0007 [uncultured bacterium (gcode 4)]